MTEQQLRAMREFGTLPIYDEKDEAGCDKLLRVYNTRRVNCTLDSHSRLRRTCDSLNRTLENFLQQVFVNCIDPNRIRRFSPRKMTEQFLRGTLDDMKLLDHIVGTSANSR